MIIYIMNDFLEIVFGCKLVWVYDEIYKIFYEEMLIMI